LYDLDQKVIKEMKLKRP